MASTSASVREAVRVGLGLRCVDGPPVADASLVVFVRRGSVTLVRAVGVDADELHGAVDGNHVGVDGRLRDPAGGPRPRFVPICRPHDCFVVHDADESTGVMGSCYRLAASNLLQWLRVSGRALPTPAGCDDVVSPTSSALLRHAVDTCEFRFRVAGHRDGRCGQHRGRAGRGGCREAGPPCGVGPVPRVAHRTE